jgi:hypothetical protein
LTACTYHHHVIHRDHVRVVPLADGFAFYRSDGALIGTTRREARRRRKAHTPARTAAAGAEGRARAPGPPGSTGLPGRGDDRTPAHDPVHADLVAAREHLVTTNGRPPADLLELLQRSAATSGAGPARAPRPDPQGRTLPTAEPAHRRAGSHRLDATDDMRRDGGERSGGDDRNGDSDPGGGDDRDGSNSPPAGQPSAPPPTLWDASLLEQPAEPPF